MFLIAIKRMLNFLLLHFTDKLVPVVLVELIFVTAVPAIEASAIISVIDDTIRKQLLSGKTDVRCVM